MNHLLIFNFTIFNFSLSSHVELGKRGYENGEDAGLRRIYRPDYRDPIETSDEPELNPADVDDDLRRFELFFELFF